MTLRELIGSPEVKAAIEAGDIRASQDKVTVSAKSSPDGKAHEKPYTRLVTTSLAGMLALCAGVLVVEFEEDGTVKESFKDTASVCGYFDYAFDLAQRNLFRGDLLSEIEGPAKAIDKAANALVAAGLHENFADAKAAVIEGRKAKGLPV